MLPMWSLSGVIFLEYLAAPDAVLLCPVICCLLCLFETGYIL